MTAAAWRSLSICDSSESSLAKSASDAVLSSGSLDMMKQTIKEHEETLDPNEPRDFTDKALVEIKGTTDPSSSFFGEKGRENLANTLYDLFLAGSETTSSTLTWALLFMARYPKVQRKVQEEMDSVVGFGQTRTSLH